MDETFRDAVRLRDSVRAEVVKGLRFLAAWGDYRGEPEDVDALLAAAGMSVAAVQQTTEPAKDTPQRVHLAAKPAVAKAAGRLLHADAKNPDPKGMEAVYRVLIDAAGERRSVRQITEELLRRDWAPTTERDPMRPTGNAAERLWRRQDDVHRERDGHGFVYWYGQVATGTDSDPGTPDELAHDGVTMLPDNVVAGLFTGSRPVEAAASPPEGVTM